MTSVADKLAKKSAHAPAKQVRLRLVYIDFWSALKLSFLISVSFAIIWLVAAFLIFVILGSTGIFGNVSALVQDVAGTGQDVSPLFNVATVMGFCLVVAVVNVAVMTTLGTVLALLYNLSVKITGGILVGFVNN